MLVYKLPDGRQLTQGQAFELGGVKFPRTWLERATPDDLSARDIIREDLPEPELPPEPKEEPPPFAVLPSVFSASECSDIIERGNKLVLREATVGSYLRRLIRPEYRRSTIGWFKPADDAALFTRIYSLASEQNDRIFGAAIERLTSLQFTKYVGENADHFDWHSDATILPDGFERKLSFVLQLSDPSDYAGGNFLLRSVGEITQVKDRGSALIFPSPAFHRVAPVTAGTRYTLVGWVEGPPC